MKRKLQDKRSILLPVFIILIGLFNYAQEDPFNCDYNAYLFQYNDIYALDLASGNSYLVKENITPGNVNAVGYNPADGYIWGSLSTPSKSIVRIGKNFSTEVFYIPELPTSNRYVGDVREDGIYYLKPGGSAYYLVDVNPNSSNYGKFQGAKTLSQNLNIHDWAFNAVDGMLYTVEKKTNNLYRIDPESGDVLDLGVVPVLEGLNYTFGAVYFDVEGRFYVSANQTGTVYVINDVQNLESTSEIVSNLFAFGPSSSLNDGARCPTAPVPQEDCINGIDDDGDGLTDCDDPACSGVAECPTIELEVSTGNKGGLESNDRLSTLINKRNYLRSKTNYSFNKNLAKKVVKTKKYKKIAAKTASFTLKDLIPLDVIPEAFAVESSPKDLIAITNATELYSVDYIKGGKTVAVILATKTENGVYEHTKYICDRLLGAELLSVSTIEIKGQTFIKSIIKNIDGSKEFALSFSGRLSNKNNNFSIESHWNIDKYTSNATFYNFQIWTNKIDDLITLGEEALELFDTKRAILDYNNSTPPPVFVKKGKYVDGALELEIVNTNKTQNIVFDAGFKRTESSVTEYANKNISLEGKYITTLRIDTGNIFDIGFRLENDNNQTPDDLFMSDGPWGVDDSSEDTNVTSFEISQNRVSTTNGYNVERNIALKATTKSYVAAYRAFTPRFKAVDLSDYSTLEFNAQGTGDLEITIIKEGIDSWNNQFKTIIKLDEEESHYAIPLSHFVSKTESTINLKDAVSIVFTMSSNGVDVVEKELKLKDIVFSQKVLNTIDDVIEENQTIVYPNPLHTSSELRFYSEVATASKIKIYNISGALIKEIAVDVVIGNNKITIHREGLKPGLYLLKVSNKFRRYMVKKLIVR